MKLAKFKIEKKSDKLIEITFLEYNSKNRYIGEGILIDFKNKKVKKEGRWDNSKINDDIFTLTFGCGADTFYIEQNMGGQLLRVPHIVIGHKYKINIDTNKYKSDFIIKRIIEVFAILSKKI